MAAIEFDAFSIAIGAVAGVVVAVAAYVLLNRGRDPSADPLPATWGQSPDDVRWEDEATDLQHTTLATVRASATAWGSSISALLGVFALVAFVKGPTALTDVKGDEAEIAAVLILCATVLAALAILLAALAAQGTAQKASLLDGWTLRSVMEARVDKAAQQLAGSRIIALGAAFLVIAAVGLTWFTALEERDEAAAKGPSAVALPVTGGDVLCGALSLDGGRASITPKGGGATQVADSSRLIIVSSCP